MRSKQFNQFFFVLGLLTGLVLSPLNRSYGVCEIPFARIAEIVKDTPKMDRAVALNKMTEGILDVLIIGGGATGVSTAHDLASRGGLRIGMIEAGDWASKTSSGSTKLNHGGVRYLEKAIMDFLIPKIDFKSPKGIKGFVTLDWKSAKQNWDLVQEGLHERNSSLKNAPHNVKPLEIFTPAYSYFDLAKMYVGLKLYEFIAGKSAFPKTRRLSRAETLAQFPTLKKEGLKGGVLYSDGQFNDSQMALDLAHTAAKNGAMVSNYTELVSFIKDSAGKNIGAVVKDKIRGEEKKVYAKTILNATGPFTDSVRQLDDPNAEPMLMASSGVHIVLPKHVLPGDKGILIPKTADGRVLFVLPFPGNANKTLVGTTDHKEVATDRPQVVKSELEEILGELSRLLERPVTVGEVESQWKAFRPLIRTTGDTKSAVRDFSIVQSESGLFSIFGGKWTSARAMGEKAADRLIKEAGLTPTGESKTANQPILGAENYDTELVSAMEREYAQDPEIAKHLVQQFGDRAPLVAEIASLGFEKRLHPDFPYIEAEVVFATEVQSAVNAIDILSRRTRLSYINTAAAKHALPRVIEIMGELKGWDATERQKQFEDAMSWLK